MKQSHIIASSVLIGLLAGCSPSGKPATITERDWSDLFLTDLKAARDIIRENHPGSLDAENPDFKVWLEEGYTKSKALAPKIKTGRDYRYALATYDTGFRDGHLIIAPDVEDGVRVGFEDEVDIRRWPGFIAAWRNNTHRIEHVAPGNEDLKQGVILSCDGKPAKQITQEQVFEFGRDPSLPAHWVNAVAYTFEDRGNGLAPLPITCTIEKTDGTMVEHKLIYRPYQKDELSDAYQKAGFGKPDAPSAKWLNDDTLWVTIPHFQPSGEAVNTYKEMRLEISANFDQMNKIIFDLRGNGGGSSFLAQSFAASLWGEKTAKALKDPFASGYVQWRVTATNIEKLKTWLANETDLNRENIDGIAWARNVIKGMSEALKRGDNYWQEGRPTTVTPINSDVIQIIENGPQVYALTDGYCASACLDFMDILMTAPGTVHLGYETSADTQYMDITTRKLPSGLMNVIFPVKVYRGRERPKGGYYTPSLRYEGVWETSALKTWVGDIIASETQPTNP